jgi:small nuclear ribonucleoprotein (snRNP)-like protein
MCPLPPSFKKPFPGVVYFLLQLGTFFLHSVTPLSCTISLIITFCMRWKQPEPVLPKPFLESLKAQEVAVKLKWGMEYRGERSFPPMFSHPRPLLSALLLFTHTYTHIHTPLSVHACWSIFSGILGSVDAYMNFQVRSLLKHPSKKKSLYNLTESKSMHICVLMCVLLWGNTVGGYGGVDRWNSFGQCW